MNQLGGCRLLQVGQLSVRAIGLKATKAHAAPNDGKRHVGLGVPRVTLSGQRNSSAP